MGRSSASKSASQPAWACWICGRAAQALDHVRPRAKGGFESLGNLRPICTICNSSKGAKWLGEERVEELRQQVARDAWSMKRGELCLIYQYEVIGALSEEIEHYKVRLEGLFSLEERAQMHAWVIRQLGGSQGIKKLRRTEGGRVLASRSGSGGFRVAYDEAHKKALEDHQRKKHELKQALRLAGIERPAACDECGTVSAIRPDGGRTPLYAVARRSDGSQLEIARSVIWKCKNCFEGRRRAGRIRLG